MDVDLPAINPPPAFPGGVFVYILMCPDGSFYVDNAKDLSRRISLHQASRGAKFTHDHPAVKHVYFEGPFDLADAVRREFQLKRWSRAKKLALIRSDALALHALNRSRD
jgi:putative endonuclease